MQPEWLFIHKLFSNIHESYGFNKDRAASKKRRKQTIKMIYVRKIIKMW